MRQAILGTIGAVDPWTAFWRLSLETTRAPIISKSVRPGSIYLAFVSSPRCN